jgi:hypothetical protein
MSLNQPAPVLADEHTVAGGSPVGTSDGPTIALRFAIPTGGLEGDPQPANSDRIIIRLPNFTVPQDYDDAGDFTLTGLPGLAGTNALVDSQVEGAETGEDSATLIFIVPDAVEIPAGSASITINSSAQIMAPDAQGSYNVTLDIQTETGHSGLASTAVDVQNSVMFGEATVTDGGASVEATHATVAKNKEDVASEQIVVTFTTNPDDGTEEKALSVADNDTITIELENFEIPSDLIASNIKISGPITGDTQGEESPAGVSVNGDTVVLMVPDMNDTALQVQNIVDSADETGVEGLCTRTLA